MEYKEVLNEMIAAVADFNSRKLWKRFTNFDCIGVRIAGEDESMLAVVLGQAGEEYGLSLFRGPNAGASFAALLDTDTFGDDAMADLSMLGFTMLAFGGLPEEDQAAMREAGQHPRYDEQMPHFMAKLPGRQPRFPRESEMGLLLLILRALVQTDKKRLLHPATLEDEAGICVLTIGGDAKTPQVSVVRERWPRGSVSRTIPLPSLKLDLHGLPRLAKTWLIGMPAIPGGIEGDDRVMQMLLVVDKASQLVIQGRPILGGDPQEAMKIVEEAFHGGGLDGRKGLPRKIIFSNRTLHDAMSPLLEPASVACSYEPVIPELQTIVADMIEYLDKAVPPFDEDTEDESEIPAPDDLKGWKAVDRRLDTRFVTRFIEGPFRSARPIKRYFDDDDIEYYLNEHKEQNVLAAYTVWGILDYRSTKTSKTQAEKMLAEGLPSAETLLLRARVEACPTLYRVANHNPKAGTVEFEDALLGGTATVHDQLMSENTENNVFIPARIFPAGHFRFIEPVGPPLGAVMGLEAVEFLRDCGMEFTPEGLRRDAQMFGWLWGWSDEWRSLQGPPDLRNTDGDDIVWHTASFSLIDPAETRKHLMKRKDIDYDQEADEFVWSKPARRNSGVIGDTVTLGRLQLVGDELVLTVNSAERFAAARRWLEKLPGVAFKTVQTRAWDEIEKDRPMDERLSGPEPVELTTEMVAGIQQMIDRQYMNWLDEPLPALGGRTPRQACHTDAGRRQVTDLIRTMPDPMGNAPIRIPRQAMLRELNLETEPAPPSAGQTAASSPPVQPIPLARKVARNAPCPCGSGRKYKQCCGR
jgi:hypothetical protein